MKADENAGEDASFASRIRHLLIRAQTHEGEPEFRLAKNDATAKRWILQNLHHKAKHHTTVHY